MPKSMKLLNRLMNHQDFYLKLLIHLLFNSKEFKLIQEESKLLSKTIPHFHLSLELVTEQNFADQESLLQLIIIFNELRDQFVHTLDQETADESKFTSRVTQLEKNLLNFKELFSSKTQNLLQMNKNQVKPLKDARATLQAQLQAENDNYAAEIDLYNKTVTEYKKQIKISKQALALITQPSFELYVKSKVGI
ncbi:unnamed protein product [Paramecium sonneborni]|uniref:Uncharacterized protein n=1 Tax=Paramecium sonneborni TaxID=65129 RepID=A0A8S1NYA0_9CILI|nr:unnamed protein product [Paramecium sonneborni]